MKREKRTKFIEANSGKELETLMNDSLKGLVNAQVQIFGKYEACIIYDEIIYEEEKTIADFFEEAGCGANCSECPYFTEPTDGRVKWTVCEKAHRRITKDSKACDSYYLERRRNVPETGRENERAGMEHERPGERFENAVGWETLLEGIPQESRGHRLFTT